MATGGGGEDEGLRMLLKEFEIWQETTANDKEIFLLQVFSNWSRFQPSPHQSSINFASPFRVMVHTVVIKNMTISTDFMNNNIPGF